MNKSRVLAALVSGYTALWFALDGAWFFGWNTVTVVLSSLVVLLACAAWFFMKRTREAIILSIAEFSWILFNVFWIRFDLAGIAWYRPVAIAFFSLGLVALAAAFGMKALRRVPEPFDSLIFRRLRI